MLLIYIKVLHLCYVLSVRTQGVFFLWHTIISCDLEMVFEYYKLEVMKNRSDLLFLFQQYYHSLKPHHQVFMFIFCNIKTRGIFNFTFFPTRKTLRTDFVLSRLNKETL
jgi:hypothetical protein